MRKEDKENFFDIIFPLITGIGFIILSFVLAEFYAKFFN